MVSAFTSTLLFITARLAYADECKEHLILFMKYGYQYVKKPFLFMLDPEFVHVVFTRFGEFVGMCPCMRGVLRFILSYRHPSLEQRVAGMTFSNPLGLSAGFDYEARLTQVLPAIGFGFGTVGTITNKFYEGNEKPRLGRLKKSRSLFVNKGFKNAGIDAGITKLEDYQFEIPIGISIGRTNDGSCDTVEKSVDDIVQAFKKVEKSKLKNSYYELNISCPNLKGNVSFYPPENLRKLLQAVEKMKIKRPIFVKMPIGKSDKEFLAMLKVITNFSVAGIIIGNLQRDRSNKAFIAEEVSQWNKGNFSGKPTEEDANRHIALAYKKYGTKLIIIGCGGVFSAEDAYEKIKHGATLVQMITGMIFEGPQVMTEINRGLVQLLERDGYKHVSEVVGK
jgi:dihydroorotate dehydrogenase subfamily 2